MKISRTWLQQYFKDPLPSVEAIADALTFHAFEIEEVEGEILDVKVLPDRAAYALSHRGIAREIAAVLNLELLKDPLREPLPVWTPAEELVLTGDPEGKVLRTMGALVRGVAVKPSPAWLTEALESLGQRSINNIVDATNYVTLSMGQPLHAFDAKKIAWHDGKLHITVRGARPGEEITVLSGETYKLPEGALVIAEAKEGTALDIAGIKGGAASAITSDTTDLFVSVANFDGPSIRRTAQALNLFTDASVRFQNKISPELAAYGMRDILALITDIAAGEVIGVNDCYLAASESVPVTASIKKINSVLGTKYTSEEIREAFDRLGLSYTEQGDEFTVTPPFERRDLMIAEDLAEEVGRIRGYDGIEGEDLPPLERPLSQERYYGIERIKDFFRAEGYTELSTQSFAAEGDIMLANPLDKSKPALRRSLAANMEDALQRALFVAPRVLGPVGNVQLFEIGSVFTKDAEYLSLAVGYRSTAGKTKPEHLDALVQRLEEELGVSLSFNRIDPGIAECVLPESELVKLGAIAPVHVALGAYRSFSIYPFALRDVAVWTPEGTEESEVTNAILKEAGDYLVRVDLFDRFEKEGRVSYAFRLVFESMERTLADTDLDPAMERITNELNSREGWEVR
ncbi:MAG TPA: phenylalanine--tRNA ligase subunit beta [Candidatus Paceibacterota bacterium]|nr:phenylalanine--tRNA ligase subunit beta [Candidatus Paceibacterota bacterium]